MRGPKARATILGYFVGRQHMTSFYQIPGEGASAPLALSPLRAPMVLALIIIGLKGRLTWRQKMHKLSLAHPPPATARRSMVKLFTARGLDLEKLLRMPITLRVLFLGERIGVVRALFTSGAVDLAGVGPMRLPLSHCYFNRRMDCQ